MKLKNIFTVVCILFLYNVNSQTLTPYSKLKFTNEPIQFTQLKTDITTITSLQMLSKIGVSSTWNEDYKVVIFIKNFNWTADLYSSDSYKRMVADFNRHDRYGHDLLRNINEDVVNQVYSKNTRFGY
jgi:hypothetical protein